MTALNAFLFGMPFVIVGAGYITMRLAKRAAADIRSHEAPPTSTTTRTTHGSGQFYTPNVAKILGKDRARAKVS